MAKNGIDLDISHAYQMFHGKTHEQAVAMFEEASEIYGEDLMWMPLRCFKFYVRAYLEYLNSSVSIGDPFGADSFLSLVAFRSHEILSLENDLRTQVLATVKFLGDHQERFDAETEIHGSFADRAAKLLARFPGEGK